MGEIDENSRTLLDAMQALTDRAEARGLETRYRVSGEVWLDDPAHSNQGSDRLVRFWRPSAKVIAATIESGDDKTELEADDAHELAEAVLNRLDFEQEVSGIDEAARLLVIGVRDCEAAHVRSASAKLCRGLRNYLSADGWSSEDAEAVRGLSSVLGRLAARLDSEKGDE
jgi:hypothetical protein